MRTCPAGPRWDDVGAAVARAQHRDRIGAIRVTPRRVASSMSSAMRARPAPRGPAGTRGPADHSVDGEGRHRCAAPMDTGMCGRAHGASARRVGAAARGQRRPGPPRAPLRRHSDADTPRPRTSSSAHSPPHRRAHDRAGVPSPRTGTAVDRAAHARLRRGLPSCPRGPARLAGRRSAHTAASMRCSSCAHAIPHECIGPRRTARGCSATRCCTHAPVTRARGQRGHNAGPSTRVWDAVRGRRCVHSAHTHTSSRAWPWRQTVCACGLVAPVRASISAH